MNSKETVFEYHRVPGDEWRNEDLSKMVQLYDTYPILQSLPGEFNGLSWTHIIALFPIKDELKRKVYATLCQKERWRTRTLQKRIDSMLYERTALSKLQGKTIEMQLSKVLETE